MLLLLSLALCLIGSAFASPRFEEDGSGSGSAAGQDNWQGATHAGSDSNGLAKPPTSLANGSAGRQAGSKHVPEALRRFNFNARKADFARTSNGEDSDVESTPKLTGHLDWAHGSEETTRQQVELADFALVITVDGSIHAIKRDTGTWLWSLHDDNTQDQRQEVVQSPLFRASMRNASLLRQNRADSTTRSENSSNIASGMNDREQLDNLTEEADEDDEVYIIEPHSAGDIYVFHKKTSKLQRLPLSLTQLVELSPFTFPVRGPSSDKDSINTDDKLFVGRKESKLVGVDLRSGKLVGVFGPEAGWCEWPQPGSGDGSAGPSQSQRSNKYLPDVDDAIENRPRDLLYLGRTDYHLSIYSKTQGLLQTLSYTSYGPSSLGHGEGSPFGPFPGEESEYRPSLDGRYIQPMHDGSLVCLDPEKDGIQWTNRFSQPVVGVFDVWYPPAQEGSTAAASQPVLSMHPHHRIHNQLKELASAPPSTFVGRLTRAGHDQGEQEYYAMSNYHFPLVSFAPASSAISGGSTSSGGHNRSQQSILGSHRVDEPIDSGRTIDAASAPLAIDPPESPARLPAGRDSVHNRPSLPPASYEAGYGEAMLKYLGIGGLDPTVSLLETTFLLAGLLVFSFAYMRKKMMNGRPSKRQENTLSVANGAQVEAQEERVSSSEGSISQQGTASFGSSSGPLVQKMRGIGHASSPSFDKELPALPVVEVPNPSNEADVVGSDEEVCADGDENGPDKARNPKKGRRRRRGGKRNTNKSTNGEGLEERDRPSPELVREEEPPSDKDINMPIVKTIPPVVAQDQSSSDVVGNLVVSESVIGRSPSA